MKKILSLTLATLMLVSMIPTAMAADVDYTAGTAVEYTADSDANRAYTITVPAELQPGQSGTVTLKGKWASNETVKVTADANVVLTNSINAADTKTLDIGFAGIEKAGDNTEEKTYTETVSVAAMPADALFGTWSGKFNYNVEFSDGLSRATIHSIDTSGHKSFTIPYEDGMTWREWVDSSYNDMYIMIVSGGDYAGSVGSIAGYFIDSNNHFVDPDSEIDANAHYETYSPALGSQSFGMTEPTWG